MIVGTQRTGSSALGDGISLHPHAACGWEWTLRALPWRAIKIAEAGLAGKFEALAEKHQNHMVTSTKDGLVALGFRRLFRSSNKWLIHPRFGPLFLLDRLEAHVKWLRNRTDIRVVHVVREDNLAWLTSKALSRESGVYFGKPYEDKLVVKIDINEAIKRIVSKSWVDSRLVTLKQSNPYLRVCYEDFRRDNKAVLDEVVTFLGMDASLLPPLEKCMRAKPQSTKSMQESVVNFTELESELSRRGLLRSDVV